MNWKHLLWIIPVSIFLGMMLTTWLHYEDEQMTKYLLIDCYCDLYGMNETYCNYSEFARQTFFKTSIECYENVGVQD